MYVPDEEIDQTSLLQGDIIRDVQILGALNLNAIQFLTPATTGGEPTGWSVSAPPVSGFAMVLSHSCEVARENGIKVTSIILAPLRDLSSATRPDKVEQLIASNLLDQANPGGSFLKYFYLEPVEKLPYERGAVVDYSKCFSVRNQSYEFLLGRKVLQLQDDIRNGMALKLGVYFYREQARRAA
jgi:hypothetical protein